jgi:hypothetical protein
MVLTKQSAGWRCICLPRNPVVLPALETRATCHGRKVCEVEHGLGGVAVAGAVLVVTKLANGRFPKAVAGAGQPEGGLIRRAGAHRRGDGT